MTLADLVPPRVVEPEMPTTPRSPDHTVTDQKPPTDQHLVIRGLASRPSPSPTTRSSRGST